MGKYEEFKESMDKLEEELKRCDPVKDSAVILSIKQRIAAVIFKINDETFEYYYSGWFRRLAKSAEGCFQRGVVSIEDIMATVAEEVWRLYDPCKGNLTKFITVRIKKRASDIREREKEHVNNEESFEVMNNRNKDEEEKRRKEDKLGKHKNGRENKTPESEIISLSHSEELFWDQASNLILFIKGRDNKRMTIRKLLWTANYSDDVFLAVLLKQANFYHERDVFKAVNLRFINHCLISSDGFEDVNDITVARLERGRPRSLSEVEWVPQEMPKPVVREEKMMHCPPSGNKVYRGYLAQQENIVRSESTISVERSKYLEWKKDLLEKTEANI